MTTDLEIGRYLAYIRDKAGLKQNVLAEKVGWSAPVLSRVESGERPISIEERNLILESIGTSEAMQLKEGIDRIWQNLPKPPLGHPNESLLWKAEKALYDIEELSERPDVRVPFARRLEESRTEIYNAANLVYHTEHSIAFIGDIGVGKTTAICKVTNLEIQNQRTNKDTPVLEAGAGGITVCEVHIVEGPKYGIIVEPKSNEEIHREVREFAELLKNHPMPDQEGESGESDSLGTTKEIERAIRNMSKLTRRFIRSVDADGKRTLTVEDPAEEMAKKSKDTDAFALEILALMELDKRTRRELWYPDSSGKPPLGWLQETFIQVNNGRHPEFSIPNRIEILIPLSILEYKPLSIRLVDTKGIDRNAIRSDIERHFNDPNTAVVLCSGFNSVPAPSTQTLLQRAKDTRITNLKHKVTVLAMPKFDEVFAVKYDDGTVVETAEDGYALKGDQANLSLVGLGISNIPVKFFNTFEDDPVEFRQFLTGLVEDLRTNHCKSLSEVINGANTLVQNYEKEQVRATQIQAASSILAWIMNNRKIGSSFSPLENSLIRAINASHASSLRASVRREGDWHNLEYSPELEFGARRVAVDALNAKLENFNAVADNLMQNPDLEDAVGLVQQSLRILEAGIEALLQKCLLLGRTIHTRDMKISVEPWYSSNNEWGRGPGYKNRVSEHHKGWFGSDDNPQARVESLIQLEWQLILDRMSAILDAD